MTSTEPEPPLTNLFVSNLLNGVVLIPVFAGAGIVVGAFLIGLLFGPSLVSEVGAKMVDRAVSNFGKTIGLVLVFPIVSAVVETLSDLRED